MTTLNDYDEKYEIAAYTDATNDIERLLRKFAFRSVVFAALVISFLGSILFIISHTGTSQAVSVNAVTESDDLSESDAEKAVIPPTPTPTVKPKTILLDAGHGGFDPGTSGTQTGICESDINLAIAKYLKYILEQKGYVVLMTRTDKDAIAAGKTDDMNARAAIIARSGADIFVCIHQNALDIPSVKGTEIYYHEDRPDSLYLAECIESAMRNIPDSAPSRGIKTYGHMLTKFMRFSVLIECGFLTNPEEEARLVSEEYQYNIAEAISIGIDNFYNLYYNE